jgi:serine/threonine-protein kinase RsbW
VATSREPELELEFPPKPEYVRIARHATAALALLHDLPNDVVDDVRLAVSEACTNALAGAQADDPIRLLAWGQSDGMLIEVQDRGTGLGVAVAGAPTDLDTEEMPFERALSLPIIRGLVDKLEVLPRDGGGAIVRMHVPAAPKPE